MKIDLTQPIRIDPAGKKILPLKEVLKDGIFKSLQVPNARELYDKIVDSEESVDLSVAEMADIQKGVNQIFISGVKWQVDDIFNPKSEKKTNE